MWSNYTGRWIAKNYYWYVAQSSSSKIQFLGAMVMLFSNSLFRFLTFNILELIGNKLVLQHVILYIFYNINVIIS